MSSLPHLPALRRGQPYASLERVPVNDYRTGAALAHISQVNAGIVRKDLPKMADSRAALKRFTCEQLIEICGRAGELFLNGKLPLGDQGHRQSPLRGPARPSRTACSAQPTPPPILSPPTMASCMGRRSG